MRTINAIVVEIVEAGALVALSILALFQRQVDKLLVRLLIGLGILEKILHQLQCLSHILTESSQGNGQCIGIDVHTVVTSKLVELLLDIGH